MSESIPPPAGQPTPDATSSFSTSTSTPPPPPPPPAYYGTPPLLHSAAFVAAVVAPVGLLLPPRRFGLRSLLLCAGAVCATSQLTYDYTGESLYQRFQRRAGQLSASAAQELPPAAVQRQAAMRAERERRRQQQEGRAAAAGAAGAAGAAAAAAPASGERGTLERIWMGNEKEDWAKERGRRQQETLAAGGSYWDLIMGQIGDVVADLSGKSKNAEAEAEAEAAEAAKPEEKK